MEKDCRQDTGDQGGSIKLLAFLCGSYGNESRTWVLQSQHCPTDFPALKTLRHD